jgi:hypothetical protein
MDEITAYFIGICTHLQWPMGPDSTPHRAILINSDAQTAVTPAAPHHARVEIWKGNLLLQRRDLNGAAVSIVGALDGTVTYDEHYRCAIPRLLLDGFAESMTLSRRVRQTPDAALVSGLIDLPNARFTAEKLPHGAVVAKATVQVRERVLISIQSFAGESEILEVEDGAFVLFRNTAAPNQDHDDDFDLHFLIADPVPVVRRNVVRRVCNIPMHPLPMQSIGPGCSNTNFP